MKKLTAIAIAVLFGVSGMSVSVMADRTSQGFILNTKLITFNNNSKDKFSLYQYDGNDFSILKATLSKGSTTQQFLNNVVVPSTFNGEVKAPSVLYAIKNSNDNIICTLAILNGTPTAEPGETSNCSYSQTTVTISPPQTSTTQGKSQ